MPYGRGILPVVVFPDALPLPTVDPFTAPLYTVTLNRSWWPYIAGAALLLTIGSTWEATDPTTLQQVLAWAEGVQGYLATPDVAVPPVEFRLNPSDNRYWDYSTDGGTTWTRQPDTLAHLTALFVASDTSPAGQKLSLNEGVTFADLPPLTATDPHAVKTDPLSTIENTIAAAENVLLSLEVSGTATGIEIAAGSEAIPALLSLLALV